MKLRRIAYFVVMVLVIVAGIYYGTNRIEVSEKEIIVESLPASIEPLKIVHISDLHGKDFGDRLINIIMNSNPDMVIFSGDMINSHDDDGSAVVDLLVGLENRYPVYYAYGNHDLYSRMNTPEIFNKYKEKIVEAGCIILDDQKSVFTKNDSTIAMYGLSSIPYNKKKYEIPIDKSSFNVNFMNQKIGKTNLDQMDILIAHDPTWLDLYAQWEADLIFSGHIHGGAIRLPVIGGIFSPNGELFPKYDAGIFKKNKTIMHVSRGMGTSVERIRIFNPPEVIVITVSREQVTGDR